MTAKCDDDTSLLTALKAGNQHAFELLYHKYKGLLYVHAYKKLGDREQVKDLIHEIFLSLWEKRSTLTIQDNFSSYLYHAVRYKVIDVIDAKNTAEKFKHFQSFLNQPSIPADYLVRERILQSIIEKEIESLPPRMRKVFELSRIENQTHSQIAEKLGLTTQSVRSHIKNALRILRIKLNVYLPFLLWLFS
jgi:RNA polymerase sigma-70 factor (family 1)